MNRTVGGGEEYIGRLTRRVHTNNYGAPHLPLFVELGKNQELYERLAPLA